jgi:hypothetical protein
LWRRTDQGWVIKYQKLLTSYRAPLNPLLKNGNNNLPREGHPPKLMDQAMRALIRGNKEQR